MLDSLAHHSPFLHSSFFVQSKEWEKQVLVHHQIRTATFHIPLQMTGGLRLTLVLTVPKPKLSIPGIVTHRTRSWEMFYS